MAVTIFEALQNAEFNLSNPQLGIHSINLAKEQLHNAVGLLERGYTLSDEVEPILELYGRVEDVPEKGDEIE